MHTTFASLATGIALLASTLTGPPALAQPTSLEWHECTTAEVDAPGTFDCTRLEVPMDRRAPGGPTFSLAVARHRTIGRPEQRLGALFYNPGGPGEAGLDVLPFAWEMLPREVRERYDLVSWDPRGTGSTTPAPAPCPGADLVGLVPETGPVDWAAVGSGLATEVGTANAACEEDNADIAAHLSSNEAAADLEALRVALGEPVLNYWGVSYGTRIGEAYARAFPDHVGVMLLDSPMYPGAWTIDVGVQFAIAGTQAYRVFAKHHPASNRQYQQVLRAVETAPATLPNGVVLDRWLVPDLVTFLSASEDLYPTIEEIIDLLHLAVLGTGPGRTDARSRLAGLFSMLASTLDRGGTEWVSSAIWCLDQAERPSPADLLPSTRAVEETWSSYEALSLMDQAAVCAGWAFAPDPVPSADASTGTRSPVLVIGSRWDGRTFGGWIPQMADALSPSRTVTYVGGQHGLYAAVHSPCVDEPVTAYLLTGALPPKDLTCPSELG
ncbi:MAG: alpha/beta fold hydrolase [Actinomycetales bacterium]|nr:alpha/beta fold hydrolase [Actinomycetales bacterium]